VQPAPTDPKPAFSEGDRVRFHHAGRVQTGIIRRFMWQDWADEPVAVIDIDPALPGAIGASLGVRIEQRRLMGKV
jgi:hypothetical protein